MTNADGQAHIERSKLKMVSQHANTDWVNQVKPQKQIHIYNGVEIIVKIQGQLKWFILPYNIY